MHFVPINIGNKIILLQFMTLLGLGRDRPLLLDRYGRSWPDWTGPVEIREKKGQVLLD